MVVVVVAVVVVEFSVVVGNSFQAGALQHQMYFYAVFLLSFQSYKMQRGKKETTFFILRLQHSIALVCSRIVTSLTDCYRSGFV